MINLLLQTLVEMNPDWGIDRDSIELCEPARRHRCEICHEIFECHLCLIQYTHPLHASHNVLPENIVFVCEECCTKPEYRFQLRNEEHRESWYADMLTGATHIDRRYVIVF